MLPFTPITDKPPQSPQPPLPGSLFAEPGHQGRGPPSQRLSPGLLLPPQFAGPGRPGAGIGVGELTSDVWQSRPVFGRSSLSCGVGFFVTLLGAGRNSFSDQAEGRERGAGRSRLRPGWGRDSATRGPGARSPEPRARAAADRPLQAAAGSDRPRVPAAGTRSGNTVCSHPGGSAQGRGGPGTTSARRHLRVGVPDRGSLGHLPVPRGSRRAVTSLEKDPGCRGEAGAYPERGGSCAGAELLGPRGRCGCAARAPTPAPAPAERPAPPLRLGLPLPRLGPAARPRSPALPRPGPPLPAPRCRLRRPEQRIFGPSSPQPPGEQGGEEEGESPRARLSTWTCPWSVAKECSQITDPGGFFFFFLIPATVFADTSFFFIFRDPRV